VKYLRIPVRGAGFGYWGEIVFTDINDGEAQEVEEGQLRIVIYANAGGMVLTFA